MFREGGSLKLPPRTALVSATAKAQVPRKHLDSNQDQRLMEYTGEPTSTSAQKLGSALFFALTSFSIIFVNKALLASPAHGFLGFPSFFAVAACQYVFTGGLLLALKLRGRVDIPELSSNVLRCLWPLALVGSLNVLCGLGGTQKISLPMFTVLRRFSIPMTMGLEWLLLGVAASRSVQFSVFLMVFGAVLAGLADMSFDPVGYLFIFGNNIFTALNGVIMKRTLTSSNISKMAVLYYNSLFGCVNDILHPSRLYLNFNKIVLLSLYNSITFHFATYRAVFMTTLLFCRPRELQAIKNFPSLKDPTFLIVFFLAAGTGSLLNYATFLCTHHNSALTTTVVGCLKNLGQCFCI